MSAYPWGETAIDSFMVVANTITFAVGFWLTCAVDAGMIVVVFWWLMGGCPRHNQVASTTTNDHESSKNRKNDAAEDADVSATRRQQSTITHYSHLNPFQFSFQFTRLKARFST